MIETTRSDQRPTAIIETTRATTVIIETAESNLPEALVRLDEQLVQVGPLPATKVGYLARPRTTTARRVKLRN